MIINKIVNEKVKFTYLLPKNKSIIKRINNVNKVIKEKV